MDRLLPMIVLAGMALSFTAAPARAAPADEASALVDRWAAAYSANDSASLTKLYAADAIVFGTAEPIVFDGSGPIGEQFARLDGSGDAVRICDRHMLTTREDAVLVTGSYQFRVTKDGVQALLPGHFTMYVVKHGGKWEISYHTSSHPPASEEAAAVKGARQASILPIVPSPCR